MIKVIAADLDGTLVNLKEAHYMALNKALYNLGYDIIPVDIHLNKLDGLSTKQKLTILGCDPEQINLINELKQEETQCLIQEYVRPVSHISQTLAYLASMCPIVLTSNAIFDTCRAVLEKMEIIQYFTSIFSNESVKGKKPSPEIYLKAAALFNCKPNEVLVLEDNHFGIKSALDAGCTVYQVKGPQDVTIYKISKYL